ncbi:MAG TPA: AmmeMemoRadiSam system protein A [Desulfopila sp.]|nr:AmmeMemoRadiSam system protein A [Desulfopila sp.]
MESLTQKQGAELVRLARVAIAARLGMPEEEPMVVDEALQARGGTFVTLKLDNQLRGCIGNIEPVGPIVDSIRDNAVNAAFHDYRFSALTPAEYEKVNISVSVLTPAVALDYQDGDDLAAKLRPGIDGVILRYGRNSATFLPQVWEQLPDARQFLGHLCLKAGLASDFWEGGEADILLYQVQNFPENSR